MKDILFDVFMYLVLTATFFLFPFWWPMEGNMTFFWVMVVAWTILGYLGFAQPLYKTALKILNKDSRQAKYACRVCGFLHISPPWGFDGSTPNYNICECCGVEFGYEDCLVKSVKQYRIRWLEGGCKWWSRKHKPENWDLETQLKNIPNQFK